MKKMLYRVSAGLWALFLFLLGIGFIGLLFVMLAGEIRGEQKKANINEIQNGLRTVELIGKGATIYVYLLVGSFGAAMATGKIPECLERAETKRAARGNQTPQPDFNFS